MTVTEMYDIDSILREAEATFQIDGQDYEEHDMDVVIRNVKQRLGRQARIDFEKYKITDPEISQGFYRAQAVMLTDSVAMLHGRLGGAVHIQRYLTSSPVSLSDVNYLGYTEESMRGVLRALQRKETAPKAVNAVKAIKEKLGAVISCREKRLFMLIIIADAIGYPEIVAVVAEILYQGMIAGGFHKR